MAASASPTPIDFTSKKFLTLGVLGLLIDADAGAAAFMRAAADEAERPFDADAARAALAHGVGRADPTAPWSTRMAEAYASAARALGLPSSAADGARFAASLGAWPAFPDAVEALKRLKKRYKLVAVTNLDATALEAVSKTLKKPFADAVTADVAGAPYPDARLFAYLIGRLSAKKIAPAEILHIGAAAASGVAPAMKAGLQTAWIERDHGRLGGGGAVKGFIAPDFHATRLWPLVTAVEAAHDEPISEEPAWPTAGAAGAKHTGATADDGAGDGAAKAAKGTGKGTAKEGAKGAAKTAKRAKKVGDAISKRAAKATGGGRAGASAPSDLSKLTIAEARTGLKAGAFTSREITEACLAAIERADRLNAVIYKTPEKALEMADAADERLRRDDASPAMCGVPVGVKDLFCTEGVPAQAASRILGGFAPPYESTVTAQLWDAGAVMLGKLNMDEFAMGSSNESSCYGPAVNPWRAQSGDADLTPGGSSGGSASAVAADLCLAATGTDTGGSIRQPAAFTGIVGLKPTYGRCSRWGIVAFASSLDQAGPMTKTVRDAAIMLEAMAGPDPKDSTSADQPTPKFEAGLSGDMRGKKIGVPKEYRLDGMPGSIERIWSQGVEWMRDAGAEIVDISLPHTRYALPAYYIIAPAEASSNLARYDGVRYGRRAEAQGDDGVVEMYERTRSEGFGAEVKRRVLIGTYVLSAGYYDAYYLRAQKVRTLIKRDFEQAFDAGVDAILTPSTPSAAFGIGDPAMEDPVKMYLNDVFTVTVNLAGLPGISVPAGLDDGGLPLGLQLIGKPWGEAALLDAALALERAAGFAEKPDAWW